MFTDLNTTKFSVSALQFNSCKQYLKFQFVPHRKLAASLQILVGLQLLSSVQKLIPEYLNTPHWQDAEFKVLVRMFELNTKE